ncbi:MAG: hypothetical protein ACRDPK_03685 [Carbonactinosporaceae bacterium]
MRDEGEVWHVGRADTGEFVVLPDVGVRALRLFQAGLSVDEASERLRDDDDDGDKDVDLVDFSEALIELGFVASLDGCDLPSPPLQRATWPGLRARHVRWALQPAVTVGTLAVILAGALSVVAYPDLLPSYRDAIWSSHGSLVVIVNAGVGWTLLLVHELAHLMTARAADVPGKMSFGTRLQFLVAQTDVSGVWCAPRRVRLTVYCAGMAVELVLASVGLLLLATTNPSGAVHTAASVVVLFALATVPWQALVFMRTDLYFVLQDLSRCPDLHSAGSTYVRHQLRRLIRREGSASLTNPTARVVPRERHVVRAYAVLLCLGTLGCLSVYFAVTLPILVTLMAGAVRTLLHGGSPTDVADALTVLALTGLVQGLWVRAWLRKHASRIRSLRWRGRQAVQPPDHEVVT